MFNINLIKDLRDLSILVDEKRLPVDSHVLLPIHALLDPYAVLLDNILLSIGDKIEFQSVLGAEFLMLLFVVGRDAKELDVLRIEFVVRITERASLECSARRVVFGVEEQDDTLSLEVREL